MMKAKILLSLIFVAFSFTLSATIPPDLPIRILVVTGNHSYKVEQFNQMLSSLGDNVTYQVVELPAAYDMFLPENRNEYDVLVFYHMWQIITEEQADILANCISEGKPLVALHHSICAYDDWPEYFEIIGGKYFHKLTVVKGVEYPVCSYIHDLHFTVNVVDSNHPVTKGIMDFEIFDETYKGYYVEEGVTPLLVTEEPSSNTVIGWTKKYGKARIVTLQSGHDAPTFENSNFRILLKQAIEWAHSDR